MKRRDPLDVVMRPNVLFPLMLVAGLLNHGWFRYNVTNIPTAFLTMGIVCLKQGDPIPQGESAPTQKQLAAPGGATPDNFTLPQAALNSRIEESYSAGDVRDPLDAGPGIFLFSYGEYVHSADGIDYNPFVERAEHITQLHLPFLESNSRSIKDAFKIVRREWFCATNQSTQGRKTRVKNKAES